MSVLQRIQEAASNFASQKNSGLRPEIKELDVESMSTEEQDAIVAAFNGQNDEIKVRRVLGARDSVSTVSVMIKSFHKDDNKDVYDYDNGSGPQKAHRRVFWYETSGGIKGYGSFPIPAALSETLAQGSWVSLSLHFIPAGTPVLQGNKDLSIISQVVFPQDTYYPAAGAGFNAFNTGVTQLQAQLANVEATITASRATAAAGV